MAKVKARVKVPKTAEKDEIVEIKILISHPMHSGRSDGDGNIVPRNIINSFTAKFNGKTCLLCRFPPVCFFQPFTSSFQAATPGTFDFCVGRRWGSKHGIKENQNHHDSSTRFQNAAAL